MHKKHSATHSVQLLNNWIAAVARLEMAKCGIFSSEAKSIKAAQKAADDACDDLTNHGAVVTPLYSAPKPPSKPQLSDEVKNLIERAEFVVIDYHREFNRGELPNVDALEDAIAAVKEKQA